MRIALSLLCSAAVLARSASLLACGASDEPYYAVGEQLPIGEGVPLNAPLVVELAERANGPESHLNPRLSLAVKGTDEALELAPLGSAPHLVWVPLQPLAPSTAYEARFNTGYEGAPDHTWQFTTGDALTSTVAIDGELQVTFEAGADPIKECGNNCGTDCKEVGQRAVTKARVRLPRASLGFPSYRATVWLTDHTPYDFSTGAPDSGSGNDRHLVNLGIWVTYDERGEPTEEALFTVPEEEEPYRPCISVRVGDERGDGAIAPPFCTEETFPFAKSLGSSLDDPGHDPSDGTEMGTSAACSFGVASANGASASLLLALAVVTRRRRSKTAL